VPGDYPTIQAAIDDVPTGSTITVAPGTYHEAINFSGKLRHVISSGGPEVTIIDATGRCKRGPFQQR
jgi:pectin methylesterase-like acyl-CoA thioesterase